MAHEFITLTDHAEVFYQMSAFFEPSAARGIRWDDPAFDISWPITPTTISERDRTYHAYHHAATIKPERQQEIQTTRASQPTVVGRQ